MVQGNLLNIQEIQIKEFPVVVFSDSHTNLSNIKRLKDLYPNNQFICLGDITFLYAKPGETRNSASIAYFMDNKIPCLLGNHDQYVLSTTQFIHDITSEQLYFLNKLPIGLKLVLPNGDNYYCFHNEPNNLWNFPYDIDDQYLKSNYFFDDKTIGIIQGHFHLNRVDNFNPIRFVVGQLCESNHHTGEKNGRNYLLIKENGVEFKKL
jgi:predicted phosphodiesterase